ncbi:MULTISPECIES: hypothetical protein [Vibrio]|uniref:hypothetical protein n=1 Tax=Vibrio TaxID=662 RepID=UPI000AC9B27D|nr:MULTISPECIES: hypothetical protein [Vibrio]EJN8560987.1 hypothetical protein [Vibrio alginolyticus]ELB2892813.1 hypothetical protein [Vibrio alginolyticus]MCS0047979.1 hypothetical protein [Vibrio antiquarius]MCZ0741653.1 hypothetical protein [Vibrio diabolicus]
MRLKTPLYKLISIVSVSLLLTACSSKPREVVAGVPLVSSSLQEFNGQIIPEKYWPVLANTDSTVLQHPEASIRLGPFYTSALGNMCRNFEVVNNHGKTSRVACLYKNPEAPNGKWYIMKNIVEDATFLNL